MRFPRASGILLHPTSLPGPHGVGGLGPEAYRFADFLAAAGVKIWQMLPLGPTGYGDSPYQCFSAFAGNPFLISPEKLVDKGLLEERELAARPDFPEDTVDFPRMTAWKLSLFEKAYDRYLALPAARQHRPDEFPWLDDFARFMALKLANRMVEWTRWDPAIVPSRRDIGFQKFLQHEFFEQWRELRAYCHARGIRLMGDIPIYVAHDSADVWANRSLFDLAPDGEPNYVAGVPPDYFSATGQLWGNPIYRWKAMEETGFQWWVERFRATFDMVDIVRLDHFRGFEAYWRVPGGDKTAVNGQWVGGCSKP
jgi:4-alpha-glucanotransferase